jgi:hypothetical protein
VVKIDEWDAKLSVGLASDLAPGEHQVQGGLNLSRGFRLDGHVIAPEALAAKTAQIWLSPFGPDLRFGPDDLDEVGQVHLHAPDGGEHGLSATLLVPEASLALIASCLSSVWKYVNIFTFDAEAQQASVSAFGFAAKVRENLAEAKDDA